MFKSKKSKTDKTKFKALFQLHFQATQVPKLKKSTGLTVSLVPEDVGKPTVRLQKTAVVDGICTWENPIYETVKLAAEPSNGKIDENIYYFVVSSGSSKAGFLGEVSIDFAEYVDATTPWLVPLPLTESESGPVLNVTIQRMPVDDADEKMLLKKEDVSQKLTPLDRNFEDSNKDHVSLKLDLLDRQFEYHARTSNVSVDGSKGTLEYQNGEKNGSFSETSCSKTAVPSKAAMTLEHVPSPRLGHNNSIPPKPAMNTKSTNRLAHQSSATDWSVDSFSDPNMSDSLNSPEYNYPNEALGERLSSFSDRPKGEGITMTRQVELLELELLTLQKQIVKETKKSQELSAKIVKLKEERDDFERQCEKIKSLQKGSDPLQEIEVPDSSVEELKKELNKEKYGNKKLRSQLHRAQDSNSELILVVRDLKKKLDENKTNLSHTSSIKETASTTDSDEDQATLKESEDAKELQSLKQKLEELYGDMDSVRNEKEEVENDLRQLSMENRRLRKENRDISSQLEQQKMQHAKMESECSEAMNRVEDLESHIGMLRIENKKQSEALSESWDTITELEAYISSLEQEVETHNAKYKAELEVMMCDKDAMEQRAVKAEETLRKIKQNNAASAEKLQKEFTILSEEMALKLDESEKMASKAQRDADELNVEKRLTEEKLEEKSQELCLVRTKYEEQLQELQNKINQKNKHIEKLSLELLDKSQEFENAAKLSDEKEEAFSMQINMLKEDIERLSKEKNSHTEQAKQMRELRDEMEDMRRTISESEILKQTWNTDRSQHMERCQAADRQAEKFQDELNAIARLKDQKEKTISNLLSQVEKLRVECDELKKTLGEEKSEGKDLKLKINQLKAEMQKKEELVISLEQQLKETRTRNSESIAANGPSKSNRSVMNPQGSQEVFTLKKKVKNLEEQIKAKDAVIGNTTSSYQEKEKHLRTKIKELESKAKKLPFSEKEFKGTGTAIASDSAAVIKSSSKAKTLVAQPIQGDATITEELRGEMALLKEKNKSMESELKDMEERYSEISLKFAEVEGERQQLVMTVRNLKNGKRS